MTIIGTNLFYDRAAGQLGKLGAQNEKLQTQIATGKRLAAPSDDAVAYRRLQTLAQGKANDAVASKNINLAQSILQEADSALDSVTSQLQRAQELAVQAGNATLSTGNRQAIASELRGIVDSLVTLANSKDARGTPLFGTATGDTAVTRDAAGTVSFTGTGEPVTIPIGDGGAVQPSESAVRIFGGIPSGGGTSDIFAILTTLATTLESGSSAANAPSIDALNTAVDQVATVRGSLGARSARLDLEAARIENIGIDREAERVGLEDTDLTTAITELQKTTTVLQAAQAGLAKLSSLSLFDYLR